MASIDLISKKTNLHVQHAFCLSLPLFCTTTTLFCRTKTSNQFLVTHYFYGGIVVCTYQRFCFLSSCSLLFFHCRSFSPCWPLAFLIFQQNFSPLFSITRSSSFSVIHVSVNIKNTSKNTRLCCCRVFSF